MRALFLQRTLYILTHFIFIISKIKRCRSYVTDKKGDGQRSKNNLPEVTELEIKAEFELRFVLTPKSMS